MREEVSSQHQVCVCVTAPCCGISWRAVRYADDSVGDLLGEVGAFGGPVHEGGSEAVHGEAGDAIAA